MSWRARGFWNADHGPIPETREDLEADGGHGEEVDGHQLLGVNLEECAPGLRRGFAGAHHVFADTALTDVEAEFEDFAMDAGCTPRGVLPAHLADQRSDLGRNDGSSGLTAAHLPGPEQAKPGTMPGNDRFWLDDDDCRAPATPEVNFRRFAAAFRSTPIW